MERRQDMTEKLYDRQVELTEARVRVIEQGKDDRGQYVVLDRTNFYPEGGGQPADTGTIGEVAVTDVQTVDGEIHHYVTGEVAEEAVAIIDWARRRDHMQQHAGQHLLSAVLEDTFGAKTVSFHLGEARASIDLDVPKISETTLLEAEQKVNTLIRQALPITIEWVTEEEAAMRNLRKAPQVTGDIRLVTIEGVDINPCGGTHPSTTAGIGVLKVVGTESTKGGTRLYFLCGERAERQFALLQQISSELTRLLNVPVPQLAEAAATLLEDKAKTTKEMVQLRKNMLELEASSFQSDGPFIFKQFGERPFKEVQQLAKLAAVRMPGQYLLFLTEENGHIRFAVGRGTEVAGDMREVLKVLLEATNGKGGGSAEFAQGAGEMVDVAAFFKEAEEIFRKMSEEV